MEGKRYFLIFHIVFASRRNCGKCVKSSFFKNDISNDVFSRQKNYDGGRIFGYFLRVQNQIEMTALETCSVI